MVELTTATSSGALWLADDEKALKLFGKYATDFTHDTGRQCAPFTICLTVCYVDWLGFEIPRPDHLPGLVGLSTRMVTACPHHALDALRVITA